MASRETSVSGFCNSVFLFRQLTHVQDNGEHRELRESQSAGIAIGGLTSPARRMREIFSGKQNLNHLQREALAAKMWAWLWLAEDYLHSRNYRFAQKAISI